MFLHRFTALYILLTATVFGQTTLKIPNRALAQDFCLQTNISGTLQDFLCGSGSTRGQVQMGPTVAALTSFAGHKIRGASDNSSGIAGHVGEVLSISQTTPASFTTSNNWLETAEAPLALTAGDWEISANAYTQANGGTVTFVTMLITATSGNNATGTILGTNLASSTGPTATADVSMAIASYRLSLSTTTNYYIKFRASYTVATPNYTYRLQARRTR